MIILQALPQILGSYKSILLWVILHGISSATPNIGLPQINTLMVTLYNITSSTPNTDLLEAYGKILVESF